MIENNSYLLLPNCVCQYHYIFIILYYSYKIFFYISYMLHIFIHSSTYTIYLYYHVPALSILIWCILFLFNIITYISDYIYYFYIINHYLLIVILF